MMEQIDDEQQIANEFQEEEEEDEEESSYHEETEIIQSQADSNLNTLQGKVYSNNTNVDLDFSASFYSNRQLEIEQLKSFLNQDSNHGVTGMKNLGNSCYINTALQMMSHSVELAYYFIAKLYEKEVNKSTGNALIKKGLKPGQVSNLLERVINPLWLSGSKFIVPSELKALVNNSIAQFNNTNGQDSQEMLNYLLDMIHEDTNTAPIQSTNSKFNEEILPEMRNESDISASKRFWNYYKERNSSIIVDLFTGQLKNTLECLACGHTSTTFQSFLTLPLAIPNMKAVDLHIVPSINIKSTIRLTVYISESALFVDLPKIMSKYVNMKVERFRTLLINGKTGTAKFTKSSENIYQLSRKGYLFVYEIDDRVPEGEDTDVDYYPFIVLFREQPKSVELVDNPTTECINVNANEEQITKSKNQHENYNHIQSFSYPRLFPIAPLDNVKVLRENIYGFLRKFYPLDNKVCNKYNNLVSKYKESKSLDEMEYENIIKEEYNLLFGNTNSTKEGISETSVEEYLNNFPFRVSLISTKEESANFNISKENKQTSSNQPSQSKSKLFFSSRREDYCSLLPDNAKIEKLIDIIKSGYKIVVEVSCPESQSELKDKLNSMVSVSNKNKGNRTPTIYDCLDHYTLTEKLEKGNEWYCNTCKKLQPAFKKLELFYVPKNFIVSFNRYEVKKLTKFSIQILKNNTKIDYPINGLNLEPYVSAKEPKPVYELYTVSQHSGSTEGGHYATACRNFGKWYEIDDASVFPSYEDIIVSPEGYVLIFRRQEKKLEKNTNK